MNGNFGGEEEFVTLMPSINADIHGDKSVHVRRTRFRGTPVIQRLEEVDLHDTVHSTYCDSTHLADLEPFISYTMNPLHQA
ncbi:hypothetical protein BGZ74_002832 [Mortierella antarctica]|nr:hypothetical protein BGZ74_002832 [Mortierella antarctica]